MGDDSSVRVAVRIRPLLGREVLERCQTCISVTPGEPQVWMGSDKTFTFDHVFDSDSSQEYVFDTAVAHLVEESLDGFNITILAYGQTGSGKTYTMGTGSEEESPYGATGIIPRAVKMIFESANSRKEEGISFEYDCQFLELYNEEIVDLLARKDSFASLQREGKSQLKIHENFSGDIEIPGLTREPVTSEFDVLRLLKYGGLSRTTAATALNSCSSRSHAIFTLSITQHRQVQDPEGLDASLSETLRAKIHFVDLAGSERLKRTGSEGIRAREGISINSGLLALGNVISALGDRSRKATHVPYRDSKLTRLLQDSLGGNSKTLMIACVSPSDTDFMETLNTFRYANRARNIKNKVQVNYDKSSKTELLLRQEVQRLQMELMEYKQGKRAYNGSFSGHDLEDLLTKNALLMTENAHLRSQVALLEEKNRLMDQITRSAGIHEEGVEENIYEHIDDGDVVQSQKLDLLTDIYKDTAEQRIVSALDEVGDPNCLALAEINNKIKIKEELLEELGKSRERILMIKQQYEQRLESLEFKIKQLEVERDRALREGSTEHSSASEIKRHYETQIQEMEKSVKHLQNLLAQQKKALADQNKLETQLRRLKEELLELKKSKVSLMNKIKEEVSKHKETERNRQKQIAQLQKATRKHEMQIRQLEAQRLLKDNILKRKIEEIATLKRSVKNLESRQEHFFGRSRRSGGLENQSDKLQGRLKLMENHVNEQIVKRQLIGALEKDLERWLEKREKLNQMLDEFAKQIGEAYVEGESRELVQDLLQEQEDVRTNISFINDNITKCQQQILEAEDSKETVDGAFLNELLSEMTVDGFRAVVKRLLALCVDFGNSSSQRELEMLELETMLNQEKQNNVIHQQLLQHVLVNSDMEVYNMLESGGEDFLNGLARFDSSPRSSLSLSTSFNAQCASPSTSQAATPQIVPPSPTVDRKARRYAAVPELLLYGKGITQSDPSTSASIPNLVQSSAKVNGSDLYLAPPTVP